MKTLHLLSSSYLKAYSDTLKVDISKAVKRLTTKNNFSKEDFEYYIIASSVFSSRIEGNTLDLNSFMRLRGEKQQQRKKR